MLLSRVVAGGSRLSTTATRTATWVKLGGYLVVCARITQRQNPLKIKHIVHRGTEGDGPPKPGSHEVRGSIPLSSTDSIEGLLAASPFLLP